jgi:UDP-N-acetylglucosamine 2-epimerase
MHDATVHFYEMAERKQSLRKMIPFNEGAYFLATIHRASNADDPERLAAILEGLGALSMPVILPVHPRTESRIHAGTAPESITLCDPVGYLEMLLLVRHARAVITDSGGLQKEAYWLKTPCVTVREETEWVETLDHGWNRLVDADARAIVQAVEHLPSSDTPQKLFGTPSRTSTASAFIAQALLDR